MEELVLTQNQINEILVHCNSMPFPELLEYCSSPKSGLTPEKLREVGYKRIDELEEKYKSKVVEKMFTSNQNSIESLMGYIEKVENGEFPATFKANALDKLVALASMEIQKELKDVCASNDSYAIDAFTAKWKDVDTFIKDRRDNWCNEDIIQKLLGVTNSFVGREYVNVSHSSSREALQQFFDKWSKIERFFSSLAGNDIDSWEQLDLAKEKIEELAEATIREDYNVLTTIDDDNKKITEINRFIQKYARNTTDTAQKYIDKAGELLRKVEEDIKAREDWYMAQKKGGILDFVDFVGKHPSCKYREEADELIQQMKGNLLSDIKRFPFRYNREMMYSYISTQTLTFDDLVNQSRVLTREGYQHILDYPTLPSEQGAGLPMARLDGPKSPEGRTDVFFFGVPGSGKTCVLASLMSLSGGSEGFLYEPRGISGGGLYAAALANYAAESKLPPKTQKDYIQVIDAQIEDENRSTHNISIIDMGGEKTRDFALFDKLEDLGPEVSGLFNNGNSKVLFFVIDPTNDKYILNDDGTSQLVKQSQVLACIANLLAKNATLMKKVLSVHIILTKSDTLGNYADETVIQNLLSTQGYKAVVKHIQGICDNFPHMNRGTGGAIGLYPFHFGNFMPGEVFTFDPTDAAKIVQIIKENTFIVRPRTFGSVIKDWFNS